MPEIKAPAPVVRANKIVNPEYCSCKYLKELGYPNTAVVCRCGNPLTRKIKND